MQAELVRKWTDALRSGDYKQTRGRLRRDLGGESKYCCLGVLCDLVGVKWAVGDTEPALSAIFDGDNSTVELPVSLRKYVGLDDEFMQELAMRNDGDEWDGDDGYHDFEPHTFSQIADVIEERLL